MGMTTVPAASRRTPPGGLVDAETVQVAAVAMHSAMGEPAVNLDRVETWLRRARRAGATFAVFPEECITGSVNKSTSEDDAVLAAIDTAARLAVPRLEALCRELGMTAVVGTVEQRGNRRFNSALVVGPDGHLATYDKMWLPGSEREYFEPGKTLPVLDSQGWRFAVGICADLQRGDYFRLAADAGAEFFLLCVAGSGESELVGPDGDQTKQAEHHRALHVKLMRQWSAQSGLYVFYANQAGKSGPSWFPGVVLVTDPHGQLVAEHLPTEGMLVTAVSRRALAAACPTGPDAEDDTAGELGGPGSFRPRRARPPRPRGGSGAPHARWRGGQLMRHPAHARLARRGRLARRWTCADHAGITT